MIYSRLFLGLLCISQPIFLSEAPAAPPVVNPMQEQWAKIVNVLRAVTVSEADLAILTAIQPHSQGYRYQQGETGRDSFIAAAEVLCSDKRFRIRIESAFKNKFWDYFKDEFGLFFGYPYHDGKIKSDEKIDKDAYSQISRFGRFFLENFLIGGFLYGRVRVITRFPSAGIPAEASEIFKYVYVQGSWSGDFCA